MYYHFREGETEAYFLVFHEITQQIGRGGHPAKLFTTHSPKDTTWLPISGPLTYKMFHIKCTPSSLRSTSEALQHILQAVRVKGAADMKSSPDPCLCFSAP